MGRTFWCSAQPSLIYRQHHCGWATWAPPLQTPPFTISVSHRPLWRFLQLSAQYQLYPKLSISSASSILGWWFKRPLENRSPHLFLCTQDYGKGVCWRITQFLYKEHGAQCWCRFCNLFDWTTTALLPTHHRIFMPSSLRLLRPIAEQSVNTTRIEVDCQWSSSTSHTVPVFIINHQRLTITPSFKNLGRILTEDWSVDLKVQNQIRQAAAAFGKLGCWVFVNSNLHLHTKFIVCQAVCLITFLYRCEAWVTYSRHIKSLDHSTLGASWGSPGRIVCLTLKYLQRSAVEVLSQQSPNTNCPGLDMWLESLKTDCPTVYIMAGTWQEDLT